jgi:hypothetical protein
MRWVMPGPPPQLAETLGAGLQVVQDDALPFAVDQIERCFDRGSRADGRNYAVSWLLFPIVSKQGLAP